MTERKLATIRKISEIKQHTNADKLNLAVIDGWQVVTNKDNDFNQGDFVVYFEIDSWIPTEIASFLSKGKEPREYEGVKGERLRSIKLRGELSQGLILPLETAFPYVSVQTALMLKDGDDVSEAMNIKKWERPMNPQLAGLARGNFPSFIRKTDQERIQNQFKAMEQRHFDDEYEVTLKVDGSSCTFFYNNGEVGVCSRNLELKTDESNAGNAFVKKFNELGLREKLTTLGRNIAIQGELWGSGINGNHEGISDIRYNVFDIYDIDTQKYIGNIERYKIVDTLGLDNVPVIQVSTDVRNFTSVQHFLDYAERPSIYNKVAEGVVFKSLTNPDYSFKAISNTFLLGGGE